MKKVMIGILILIPIIVLLIVLAVGAIVSMEVYISVEEISLVDADGNPVRRARDLAHGVNDERIVACAVAAGDCVEAVADFEECLHVVLVGVVFLGGNVLAAEFLCKSVKLLFGLLVKR